MSRALIVAGLADADFAEEVRRTTRGLDIEIARSLPVAEQRTVLLVWSAAAPATAADVPTLIDLWSQGRLVIARRDGTALPLGLGDLDTVPAGAPARETALKLLHAALAPGEGAPGEGAPVAAPPPPASVESPPPPTYEPAPAAMARSTRRWPMAVAAAVLVLVAAGGVASWLQQASQPPDVKSAAPEETAMRRDIEAAARRMQEELSQRERSSSAERENRAVAERAAAERAAAERNAREPSSPTAVAPSSPPPPASLSPAPPPPPSSAAPTDDARIVDLERQIAELKSRLESGAADGSRARASEMPVWAPWAAPDSRRLFSSA
ncbi:MAG: hypothetical protein WCK95_24895, partial [Alphaproteobacteria bacterium]